MALVDLVIPKVRTSAPCVNLVRIPEMLVSPPVKPVLLVSFLVCLAQYVVRNALLVPLVRLIPPDVHFVLVPQFQLLWVVQHVLLVSLLWSQMPITLHVLKHQLFYPRVA